MFASGDCGFEAGGGGGGGAASSERNVEHGEADEEEDGEDGAEADGYHGAAREGGGDVGGASRMISV